MKTHHGATEARNPLARKLGAVLMLIAMSMAQQVTIHTPNDYVSYPNYVYNEKVSSLRDVDFKNLTVFWFYGKKRDAGVRLKGGAFQRKRDFAYEEVHLDLVEFPDEQRDGIHHAVIDLKWADCGGSCTVVGRVQVFELRSGHPVVVQEIEYDRHADGTGVRWDSKTWTLTVTGRSDDRSPDCCPGSLDVMTFKWVGNKFTWLRTTRVAAEKTQSNPAVAEQ